MNNTFQEGEVVPEATLKERVIKLERLVEKEFAIQDLAPLTNGAFYASRIFSR